MNNSITYNLLASKPRTNNPVKIILHHSGGTDKNPLEDTSHHTAKIMESHHLSLGWEGLGYHYVVHKNGDVWRGRPEHYHGAHCKGHNNTSIGICMAGNFDNTKPTPEQEIAVRHLIDSIKTRYPINEIVPHRKYANKTCYGKNIPDDYFIQPDPKVETIAKLKEILALLQELLKMIQEADKVK